MYRGYRADDFLPVLDEDRWVKPAQSPVPRIMYGEYSTGMHISRETTRGIRSISAPKHLFRLHIQQLGEVIISGIERSVTYV